MWGAQSAEALLAPGDAVPFGSSRPGVTQCQEQASLEARPLCPWVTIT